MHYHYADTENADVQFCTTVHSVQSLTCELPVSKLLILGLSQGLEAITRTASRTSFRPRPCSSIIIIIIIIIIINIITCSKHLLIPVSSPALDPGEVTIQSPERTRCREARARLSTTSTTVTLSPSTVQFS